MSLAAIAFDPTYIAFDERDFECGEELERRILLLTSARRLMLSNRALGILTSDETGAELVRTNFYPYHDRMETLLNSVGLGTIYSANDVRVIVQEVIGRSESLEEYVGVNFALYGDGVTTSPDCTKCYTDGSLLELFLQVLGTVSAGLAANANIRDSLRVCCPAANSLKYLQFSGLLEETEPDLGFRGNVEADIVLVNDDVAFLQSLDGLSLWRRAVTPEEIGFSLFVGAIGKKIIRGEFRDRTDFPIFNIGSAFVDSLVANQAMGTGRFSRATFETALSVICENTGVSMWKSERSGKKQIVRRDGALAWRCHVSSRHEALRLMYWKKDGMVEFANVGNKSELTILDGDGQGSSTRKFARA